MPPPIYSVMGVPKLAEMILLQVPVRDLLLAQRVDRTWRATIRTSPALQQALFLRPYSDRRVFLETGITPATCSSAHDCPKGRQAPAVNRFTPAQCQEPNQPTLAVANPFLRLLHLSDSLSDSSYTTISSAYARPEASWRNMLITQPPLEDAVMYCAGAGHFHLMTPGAGDALRLSDWHEHITAFQSRRVALISSMGCVAPKASDNDTAAELLGRMRDTSSSSAV